MIKIILISGILMTAAFAQAEVLRCFRAGNYKTGEISISRDAVSVDYDLKEKASYSIEGGRILSFDRNDNDQISFSTFLSGTGDGTDVQITLTSKLLIIQSLDGSGELVDGAKEVYKLKACK